MKSISWQECLLMTVATWLLTTTCQAQDQDSSAQADTARPPAPQLAVLPFANYTEQSEAISLFKPLLYQYLAETGISFLSESEIRPLLRQNRIRSVGQIGFTAARLIQQETGVQYLLLGSFDIFEYNNTPELCLSVRILDLENLVLIKAVTAAATGEDYSGLFSIGRIDDMAKLADRTMQSLFKQLGKPLLPPASPAETTGDCRSIAIVPLDNLSGTAYAGDILSNILLSQLVSSGYLVVEKGFVNEIFLQEQVMPRGQIDSTTLSTLYSQLEPCLVITGSVERFHPARGNPDVAVPDLSYGVRLLEGVNGRLVMTYDTERSGTDGELFFRFGRDTSLGRLSQESLDMLVEKIDNLREKQLAEAH